MLSLIEVPSLIGINPKLEALIAAITDLTSSLEYGLINNWRGSGIETEAIWINGVGHP